MGAGPEQLTATPLLLHRGPPEVTASFLSPPLFLIASATFSKMPLTNGVPYHFSTKWSNGVSNGVHEAVNSTHEAINRYNSKSSLLERAGDDELHDIVCVGFGPAALSIAVALNDSIEAKDPSLRTLSPKVRFIERQPTYQWHPGMLLEDSKMQITFMKDMATLRNPRSHFTFVNYLHNQQRLVQFTNLNTMLPKRLEYNDYMRWCASAFDSVVEYGRSVVRIEAVSNMFARIFAEWY